jgi:hypothetical protein
MTEYKPFSRDAEEAPGEPRTVGIVLSIPTPADDAGRIALQPTGDTTLAEIALGCLCRAEADERWLLSLDAATDELFAKGTWPGVSLLRPDPDGGWDSRSTHLMLLGPFHPFLRPSTLSEAVRLFKMRTDIATLVACVRNRDALYDETGKQVVGEHDERTLLRAAHAFQIAPRKPSMKSGAVDPYPFEISSQEGWFVDSEFELGLLAAWQKHKQQAAR